MSRPFDAPPTGPPPQTRLVWLDSFRGLAIVLVVAGHVVGGIGYTPYLTGSQALREAYAWIYAFHMPAFFWAAGLVTERSLRSRGPGRFLTERGRTLMYPYLLWGLIGQLISWLAQGYVNSPYDSERLLRMLYDPAAGLWFLYTLFLLSVVYAALWRVPRRQGVFLLAAAGGYATFIVRRGDLPPGLHQVCHYGVYLAAGVVAGPWAIGVAGRWSVAALGVFAATGFAAMTTLQVGWGPHPATELPKAALGIAGLFGVAALAARIGPPALRRALEVCGQSSLEIYLAHPFTSVPFRVGLYRGLGVTDPFLHVVAATAGGVLGPLLLAWVARRSRLRYLFKI